MPVEWRRTVVSPMPQRRIVVEHWSTHPPLDVLRALETRSLRSPALGESPEVGLHPFKRMRVAVRHGVSRALFEHLKSSTINDRALVELPVAFVHDPFRHADGTGAIVTKWKERTTPLVDYLHDATVPYLKKKRACVQVMKALARLHHAGFVHYKPTPENVVVSPAGRASLVDFTEMEPRRYGRAGVKRDTHLHFTTSVTHPLYRSFMKSKGKRPEGPQEWRFDKVQSHFGGILDRAYLKERKRLLNARRNARAR